jgi:RNA polymerase sigma-54 factor
MAGEMKQQLRTSQSMSLSPQIQQAIKILTLGRQELQEMIDLEIHENPCLEQVEPGQEYEDNNTPGENIFSEHSDSPDSNAESQFLGNENVDMDLRRIGDLLSKFDLGDSEATQASGQDTDDLETPIYDRFQQNHLELHESLEEQLRMMHLTSHELFCALALLQYLSDEGFMQESLESIGEETGLHPDDLEYGLENVRKCEPVGVGAKNLQDCLLMQCESKGTKDKTVLKVLRNYWPEFQKQDAAKISKASKLAFEDVRKAFHWIRDNLDPRPARQFGSSQSRDIAPDVYIFQRDEKWTASINEEGLPRLKVSQKYQDMLAELSGLKLKAEDLRLKREFVGEKVRNARALMIAIGQRNRTILRVAEVIAEKQQEFLEKGIEYLRPLTLKMVADDLQLHESTISRTTSQKYVHTPRGLFELKYFFNSGMTNTDGEELANSAIKNWVGDYIKAENPDKPLSDLEIAAIISKEKGIKVARRTVAKYRESLNLLSSSKRKRLA